MSTDAEVQRERWYKEVMQVRCPSCHVEVGKPCLTPSGKLAQYLHSPRQSAARGARKKATS